MSKIKSVYVCQNCSAVVPNWVGQCPKCGEWNTLLETLGTATNLGASKSFVRGSGLGSVKALSIVDLETLDKIKVSTLKRLEAGISEFDRVLGGGFVPGQVVLLAGEPGVGKSTLITQVCKSVGDRKVLYICGEESPSQIKVRTERMGYEGANLFTLQETELGAIEQVLYSNSKDSQKYKNTNFDYAVVDSIQTMYTKDLI